MHLLLADENFSMYVANLLTELGHDVISLNDLGLAGIKYPDEKVLHKANELNRCILTFNRKNFIRLHNQNITHAGIVVCTFNRNPSGLADKIHQAISKKDDLSNQLIRIYRGLE